MLGLAHFVAGLWQTLVTIPLNHHCTVKLEQCFCCRYSCACHAKALRFFCARSRRSRFEWFYHTVYGGRKGLYILTNLQVGDVKSLDRTLSRSGQCTCFSSLGLQIELSYYPASISKYCKCDRNVFHFEVYFRLDILSKNQFTISSYATPNI